MTIAAPRHACFIPYEASATKQGLEACEPGAVPCSPGDPCPYCFVTTALLPSSAVLWKHSFLLLALPSPRHPRGLRGRVDEREEDGKRQRKRKRNSPQTARAGKTRERSAPFAAHLWDLAPTVSIPESRCARDPRLGQETDLRSNRPTGGFPRKRCERRNGEAEFSKVEAPQGGPSQPSRIV